MPAGPETLVFKYNAYKNHIYIKFDDYKDITAFNIAFNNSIEIIIKLKINTISTLYSIIYIITVAPLYPI